MTRPRQAYDAGRIGAMLHVVTLLGIASPLLLEQRVVLAFRFWLRTALHLALAFGIAAMVYGLILLAITETYPPGGSLATVFYGFGLALAGLLAICGATLIAPERLGRVTFMGTGGLAVLLPLGLYVQMAVSGDVRMGYLLYLLGGFAGTIAAMRLMPWAHAEHRTSRV